MIARKAGRWLPMPIDDVRAWQNALLESSAHRLGVRLADEDPVHRWGSVGASVEYQGQRAWLRVSPYLEHEMDEAAWRGTREAAVIAGVRKPALLASVEWVLEGPVRVSVSAEVLTYIPDRAASAERFLAAAPDLAATWFEDLAGSLAALAAHPTGRRFVVHDRDSYDRLLAATYRRPLRLDLHPEFGTEHLDLSWENVSAPAFHILDMEHWGIGVRGYGAAYLYLTALAAPDVAAKVHDALADVLDTPSGRYAQFAAAALIIRNLTRLPDPLGLAGLLHRHTDTLLA